MSEELVERLTPPEESMESSERKEALKNLGTEPLSLSSLYCTSSSKSLFVLKCRKGSQDTGFLHSLRQKVYSGGGQDSRHEMPHSQRGHQGSHPVCEYFTHCGHL